MSLSCVILTKNSDRDLEELLPTLEFCQEIVVVDDFSSDQTEARAKQYSAKFIQTKVGQDFAKARNLGLKAATKDWVLFVDSDERISPALANEISQAIQASEHAGYRLPRQDKFFGKVLSHGENASNRFLRLARRQAGKWTRPVHEVWQVSGQIGELVNPLIHDLGSDLDRFIDKINHYSHIEAKLRQSEGQSWSMWQTLVYPSGKFLHNYFVRLGFLDGFPGLIMASMMSLHSISVRIKLYE